MALTNVSKDHTTNILAKLSEQQIICNHTVSKLKTQSSNIAKLEILYKQMMFIKKEIHDVLNDINMCNILGEIPMKCKKYPGQNYYLYKKDDESLYLSRLSPQDYNFQHKDSYIGCYLLDNDYIWKKME